MKVESVSEEDYGEIMAIIRVEFPYVEFNEAKVRQRVQSGKIFLFKAVDGKDMLGFIEVELLEGEVARINGLTVKPEHRNKGVAKALLDYAISFLKKKNVERLLLLVKQKNEAAKKVYREAGFEFIGMYSRELDNEVVEEMELDLVPGSKEDLSYVS